MSAPKSTKAASLDLTAVTVSDPADPATYRRRVLLAVTGLSPQIVTETLYALVRPPAGQKPFVPTEVQIITTEVGAQLAIKSLLTPHGGRHGWFHRLCADYELPLIRFDPSCVHVVAGSDGDPLDDIRSQSHSESAANFITDLVRSLTGDSSAALHVSIAGGRKTMGFYLGYAFSLFARQQDRLSHVLVSHPYESHLEFFYPTAHDEIIRLKDGSEHNTRYADVTLASIPVVGLRHELPRQLQSGTASYTDTVQAMQAALAPSELVIDIQSRLASLGGKVLRLQPSQFAILALLAYQALEGLEPLTPPPPKTHAKKHQVWSEGFTKHLREALGEFAVPAGLETKLRGRITGAYLSPLLAKLRKSLAAQLGATEHACRIDDGSAKPKCYRLAIPAERIRFGHIDGLQTRKRSKR